jgi:hypothetical protein
MIIMTITFRILKETNKQKQYFPRDPVLLNKHKISKFQLVSLPGITLLGEYIRRRKLYSVDQIPAFMH